MDDFAEKAKMKKVGNLNSGRSYLITTVKEKNLCLYTITLWGDNAG